MRNPFTTDKNYDIKCNGCVYSMLISFIIFSQVSHVINYNVVHIRADFMCKEKIFNGKQPEIRTDQISRWWCVLASVDSRHCQKKGKMRYCKLIIASRRSDTFFYGVKGNERAAPTSTVEFHVFNSKCALTLPRQLQIIKAGLM